MILHLLRVLLLCALVTACSGPGYYFQAMSGQWKLLHAREDIDTLIRDPETDPELTADLKVAGQIKSFAKDRLDLPGGESYTSFVQVDGEALVWNVVATEEFSLAAKKWCFPIAGCVPYRGYFKSQTANEFAERLQNRGMDVVVTPAAAYSTLGWFDDPLLSTMLNGSETRLAAYLFHELAHQRIYVKNDGAFNEGYASFVEEAGVLLWLESNDRQAELNEWLQLDKASADFSELVAGTRDRLAELYAEQVTEENMRKQKAAIFREFTRGHEQLASKKWQGRMYYGSWLDEPLNNARLALFGTYEGSRCAFRRLWEQSGKRPEEFHQLAEQKSRLEKSRRQEWLNR
jgi:predicted aminopeptidase